MRKTLLKNIISTLCLALGCAIFCSGCAETPETETPAPTETAAPVETPALPSAAAASEAPEVLDERLFALELSELMPSNKSCLLDEDGDFSDWLELYNSGNEPLSLEGLWLSDSLTKWDKWQFPARTLDPGEYLLVFCSGKDRSGDELHTSFSLSGKGETLTLRGASGQLIWERGYDPVENDVAVQFTRDDRVYTREATPGYPNTLEGREAYWQANDRHGALVINEAVCYNDTYLCHLDRYFEWIELKNVSDDVIDLGRYSISDKVEELGLYHLPSISLYPGAMFIVFCGEPGAPTRPFHVPFELSSAGDTVYLSEDGVGLSDYAGLYDLPLGSSYGRMDEKAGFFYFSKRTPKEKNVVGLRLVSEKPAVYPEQGLYPEGESLTVTLSGEGTIYYTLNGATPTNESLVYTEPFTVDSSTVVRAICIGDGKLASDPVSCSYLFGVEHTLPVVSLVCDPMDYRAIETYKSSFSYPGNFTLFDGENSVQLGCGYELHGGSTRNVWRRKTLKLVFRNRYDGDLHYDLFQDGRSDYHAILLRGGFMSAMQLYRDSLASLIANEVCPTDPLTLNSRYCILYQNGRYRGIYALREAYCHEYVASHTGSDPDKVKIIRMFPHDLEDPDFEPCYTFVTTADYSEAGNYERAAEMMDMQSLAQWLCIETYFVNADAIGNLRFCKGDAPDGKWRTMLFDFDVAMGEDKTSMSLLLQENAPIGKLLLTLRRSEEFRLLTLETAAAMYHNGMNYQHVTEVFNSLVTQLEPELDRDLNYWCESAVTYEEYLRMQVAAFTESLDRSWMLEVQEYTRASDEQMRSYFPEF